MFGLGQDKGIGVPERLDNRDPGEVVRFFQAIGQPGRQAESPLTVDEVEEFDKWRVQEGYARSKVQRLDLDQPLPPNSGEGSIPDTVYIRGQVYTKYPMYGSDRTIHPFYGMAYRYDAGFGREVVPTPELKSLALILESQTGGILATIKRSLGGAPLPRDLREFVRLLHGLGITSTLKEWYKGGREDPSGKDEALCGSALSNLVYPKIYNDLQGHNFDIDGTLNDWKRKEKKRKEALKEQALKPRNPVQKLY